MFNFQNKIIIITGGFAGNGLCVVKKFLESGAKVYALDKQFPKKFTVSKNLIKLKVNLESYSSIKNTVNKIMKKKKKIDCQVNNAGISIKFSQTKLLDVWSKTLSVNLTAPYVLSYLLLPYLKKSSFPSIINITSLNGKIAMSNNPAYNASKGGLSALNSSLAMDFAKYKIRVNAVSPGYIKTNMTKKSFNTKSELKKRVDRMMIKNYGEPEDVASTVLFLASTLAKYINASEIVVDGGLLKKGI